MIKGIDVSKWQGAINWQQVKADGIEFAIIKATEGALPVGTYDAPAIAQFGLDPDFRSNFANAKAAGIARGAYHFGRPDLGNTAQAEAEWFYSIIGSSLQPGDLVALDLEEKASALAQWAAQFEAELRALCGFNPFFYASPGFMSANGITFANIKGSYGLWEADWTSAMPPPAAGWPVLAIWQDGSAGTLAGINGKVDGDIFNGDLATLLKYGKPAPPDTSAADAAAKAAADAQAQAAADAAAAAAKAAADAAAAGDAAHSIQPPVVPASVPDEIAAAIQRFILEIIGHFRV